MSTHAGISVVDIDDPQPIRDHAQDIQNATGQTSEAASSANSSWQALSGQYVDPVVGPTIHSAYNRPANEASELSSAGTMAHSALSTLADTYESLRKRRQALITDLDKLASDEAKGDKDSKGKNESKRAELQQEASTLSSDKQNADALAIVALGGIPSPTGEPRSKDASAGYYGGIKQDAAEGAKSAAAAAAHGAAKPGSSLGDNLKKSFIDDWFGLRPPWEKDAFHQASWGLSKAMWAAGFGIDYYTKTHLQKYQIIGKNGQTVPMSPFKGNGNPFKGKLDTKAMWNRFKTGFGRFGHDKSKTLLENIKSFNKSPQFRAKSGLAESAESMGKIAKGLSRGGTALTAVTAFVDEYNADKGESDERRTAKAGTVAAGTAAGAWAGAEGGGMLGAAIGTAIAPGPGTVIGGAIGGIAGGIAGSELGKAAGNALKDSVADLDKTASDTVSKADKAVNSFAKDAGDHIGDAAKSVGDKLKFWD